MKAKLTFLLMAFFLAVAPVLGDSIWERRNPYFAYMFIDTKARRVGDVLTVAVNEATLFDGQEGRTLEKDTQTSGVLNINSGYTVGTTSARTVTTNAGLSTQSQRQLLGTANYKSDRTFTDKMSVVVIDVMPNGNLVIEGYRSRVVGNEEKMLRLTGIVRPIDIGAGNVVQSSYIADFRIAYIGRGVESGYLNNGWFGRFMNVLWPF